METGILLESGTNELEILEFRVGGNSYGINVAKIREILQYQTPTPIPNSDPRIEGIFMPRENIISIIDLCEVMHLKKPDKIQGDMFIVTNFNRLHTAFHVHGVEGIHRVSWTEIVKPDSTINGVDGESMATGIIRINGKLIIILDFEQIVATINPETGLKASDVASMKNRGRNDSPILIAEDSPLLSKMIVNCMKEAGYVNVTATTNGQECWETLMKYQRSGNLDDQVSCIITDIEMPQMDGHRLTKLVKDSEALKHIPVIIFSSLINEEMQRKGEQLGANAQLSKPEIGKLVETLDGLIGVKPEGSSAKQ